MLVELLLEILGSPFPWEKRNEVQYLYSAISLVERKLREK